MLRHSVVPWRDAPLNVRGRTRASLWLTSVTLVAWSVGGCASTRKDGIPSNSIAGIWKLTPEHGVDPGPLADVKAGWSVDTGIEWTLCWNENTSTYKVIPTKVWAHKARDSQVFMETVSPIAQAATAAALWKLALDGVGGASASSDVTIVSPPGMR